MTLLAEIRKTLVALGVLIGVVADALADGRVSVSEGVAIALAAAGVVGVFSLKNQARLQSLIEDAQRFGLLPKGEAPVVVVPPASEGPPVATGETVPTSVVRAAIAPDEDDGTLGLEDAPAIEVGDPEAQPVSRANL